MFGRRKKVPSFHISSLFGGNFSQAEQYFRYRYKKLKRQYYLFIFLPGVLLAVLYRAVVEYRNIRRIQAARIGTFGTEPRRPAPGSSRLSETDPC